MIIKCFNFRMMEKVLDWEVVSDNKLVSVRAQSPTEINAYGEDCRNAFLYAQIVILFVKK